MSTITSANAQMQLSVPDVFGDSNPQTLSQWSTDDAWTHESFAMGETRMGVDGKLSAGFTPNPKDITVTFQADSDSIWTFQEWGAAEEAAKEKYKSTLTLYLPATGTTYTASTGWLMNFKKLPDGKKVLESQQFSIRFQDITVSSD